MWEIGFIIIVILLLLTFLDTGDFILLLTSAVVGLGAIYAVNSFQCEFSGGNEIDASASVDKKDIFEDKYQDKLESDLTRVFQQYEVEFDPEVVTELHEYHRKSVEQYPENDRFSDPLVGYPIINGTCIFSDNAANSIKDMRAKSVYRLIENTLKWCKQVGKEVPDTTLYVYISDHYPTLLEKKKFPVFVFARPANYDIPIIPDGTFEKLAIHRKYKEPTYNWDETKKEIIAHDTFQNKTDIIYFHGTDTTNFNHNIRKNLEHFSKKSDIPIDIELNAWKKYEPIWDFSQYKYLLNLPGRYPWSNRLKYLLAMNSVVINVSVITKFVDTNHVDDRWISFTDYFASPGEHYIDIPYTWYTTRKTANDNDIRKALELKHVEDKRLHKQLQSVYLEIKANKEKYKEMVADANSRTKQLTLSRVYQYMYHAILLNSKYNKK